MKYIIEIEEEPFGRNDDPVIPHGMDELYRAKGFNALVFDKHGLDKLTPLNKELEEAYQKGYNEAKLIYQNPNAESDYQRGLDDAWGCARKLFSEMSDTEINLVFPQEWNNGGFKALMALHPQDAIDRINAFERKQESDEIKVGDDVKNIIDFMNNVVGYFFGYSSDGRYKVLRYVDGKFETGIWNKEHCVRTGGHSYAVERMVAVLKGEQENNCLTCRHDGDSAYCEVCKDYKSWQPKGDENCDTCKHQNSPNGARCRNCFDQMYQWEPKEGAE